MKINSVVVTYNRLNLLKENITALKKQTYSIDKIFIIDNQSTDETAEYLKQFESDAQMKVITLPYNAGGAGGFARGIQEAVEEGCDWVWVMDDDTIPAPEALELLLDAHQVVSNVGFISSKVLWTDHTSHQMNLPEIDRNIQNIPFNQYSSQGVLLIKSASFVSCLLSSRAILKVGLPIADFFIWGDDLEYTTRISEAGYLGLYVDSSVVCHKTNLNYTVDLATAPLDTAWKFFYEKRNRMYLLRRKKKNYLSFLFSSLGRLKKDLKRVKKRKKEDREVFRKKLLFGFWAGLRFNPSIERISLPYDKEKKFK